MSKNNPTTTICCIAKHEEDYIHEWIRYHLYLGVDCIQIHDNSEDNCLRDLHLSYDQRVEVVHFPGLVQQIPAYNDLLKRSKKRFTFAAFIDLDEFIVLRHDPSISAFLNRFNFSTGVAVNWVLFGSNFREFKEKIPVLERFVRRQIGVDRHIKSIVRLDHVEEYSHPHHPTKKTGHLVDVNGNIVEGPFNPLGDDSEIALFHFTTKSKEEFLLKGNRLRSDCNQVRGASEEKFLEYNIYYNQVTDYTALEFYLRHDGQSLEKLTSIRTREESSERLQMTNLLQQCSRILKESQEARRELANFHEIADLNQHLSALVESAYAWQRKPWYVRALRRWRGFKRAASHSTGT